MWLAYLCFFHHPPYVDKLIRCLSDGSGFFYQRYPEKWLSFTDDIVAVEASVPDYLFRHTSDVRQEPPSWTKRLVIGVFIISFRTPRQTLPQLNYYNTFNYLSP